MKKFSVLAFFFLIFNPVYSMDQIQDQLDHCDTSKNLNPFKDLSMDRILSMTEDEMQTIIDTINTEAETKALINKIKEELGKNLFKIDPFKNFPKEETQFIQSMTEEKIRILTDQINQAVNLQSSMLEQLKKFDTKIKESKNEKYGIPKFEEFIQEFQDYYKDCRELIELTKNY